VHPHRSEPSFNGFSIFSNSFGGRMTHAVRQDNGPVLSIFEDDVDDAYVNELAASGLMTVYGNRIFSRP
jgi:hypothetical protein